MMNNNSCSCSCGCGQGPSGPEHCVCCKCGEKVEHQRGIQCAEMKCPKCGASMKNADLDNK